MTTTSPSTVQLIGSSPGNTRKRKRLGSDDIGKENLEANGHPLEKIAGTHASTSGRMSAYVA